MHLNGQAEVVTQLPGDLEIVANELKSLPLDGRREDSKE